MILVLLDGKGGAYTLGDAPDHDDDPFAPGCAGPHGVARRTACAGFTLAPFTFTWPARQAALAAERVE